MGKAEGTGKAARADTERTERIERTEQTGTAVYRTVDPLKVYDGEYTEKKSRFIAALTAADSEEAALSFLNGQRRKYYDARHHCSAYILHSPSGGPAVEHSSDDGEPSGTAGRPMLSVIGGEGLENVIVVVTRYFGGTLLGTGGLVRAYTQAAQNALMSADILEMRPCECFEITFGYPQEGTVRRLLEKFEASIEDSIYSQDVTFQIAVEKESSAGLKSRLVDILSGNVLFGSSSIIVRPVPV